MIDFGPSVLGRQAGTLDYSADDTWTYIDQTLSSPIAVTSGWSFVSMTCNGNGTAFPRAACRHAPTASANAAAGRTFLSLFGEYVAGKRSVLYPRRRPPVNFRPQ